MRISCVLLNKGFSRRIGSSPFASKTGDDETCLTKARLEDDISPPRTKIYYGPTSPNDAVIPTEGKGSAFAAEERRRGASASLNGSGAVSGIFYVNATLLLPQ